MVDGDKVAARGLGAAPAVDVPGGKHDSQQAAVQDEVCGGSENSRGSGRAPGGRWRRHLRARETLGTTNTCSEQQGTRGLVLILACNAVVGKMKISSERRKGN